MSVATKRPQRKRLDRPDIKRKATLKAGIYEERWPADNGNGHSLEVAALATQVGQFEPGAACLRRTDLPREPSQR